MKSGASEAEIYTRIEEYKEKFADYGRDRRSAIEFHLRNIERLLMPTQTTSVVLATLQMGSTATSSSTTTTATGTNPSAGGKNETNHPEDSGSADEPLPQAQSSSLARPESSTPSIFPKLHKQQKQNTLDAKSLFRHLVEILQVTPEQSAALKDSRFVAQEMDECLKASLGVLKELRQRLMQCGEDLEHEFNNVRSILTPTQAAKFLVWVANNKACIHMLNELWNRVYPQQYQERQSTTPTDEDVLPSAELSSTH